MIIDGRHWFDLPTSNTCASHTFDECRHIYYQKEQIRTKKQTKEQHAKQLQALNRKRW